MSGTCGCRCFSGSCRIRQQAPEVIRRRLERAVEDGELAPDLDTAAVAAFYATVIHGLGIGAGDGAPRAALMAAVDGAMAAWAPLTATCGSVARDRRRTPSRPAGRPKTRVIRPPPKAR